MHYFSDRCDRFKTVLPQLTDGAGTDNELVFVVESPLSEVLDESIRLHQESDWPDQVVVNERNRAFFEAVKVSLNEALSKLEQIEFVAIDDTKLGTRT